MFSMSVMFGKAGTKAAALAFISAGLSVLLFSSCGAEDRGECAPFAPAVFEKTGKSFPYGYFSFA